MTHFFRLLLLITLMFAPLAVAQDAETPAGAMVKDTAIQTRLNDIYASTTEMSAIQASVENGVVTLSGEIGSADLASDVVNIAKSQDGTVYVQDQMDRLLIDGSDVGSALGGLSADAVEISRALPLIGLALVIIGLFWWLGGFVSRRKRFWQKVAPNPFLGELLAQTARVLFIVGGIIIALNILGAQGMIATILGGAGVIGLAIGFAVRDTLENYFASIMLSLRQPFRAGDHVLIEGQEGKVMRLTSRATILMTLDGNHLRIPNSVVFKAVILNYSTNPERRFSFELGIDAADDPVAAMQMGLDIIRGSDFVESDPAPSAVIMNVGDSNIVIKFQGWVNQTTADFGKARSLSIRGVKDALESSGFSLPEPIYRVKLDNMAGTNLDLKTSKTQQTPSSKSTSKPMPVSVHTDAMDFAPDTAIDEKVDEDNAATGDNLLDDSKPIE